MNPEEKARIGIDNELIEAGWVIQDRKDFNKRIFWCSCSRIFNAGRV